MTVQNEMTLSFESRSSNESFARSAVSAFAAQLDPTIAELNEIRTAVSEAVTNCVVHAYRDTIGIIRIQVKLTEDHQILIKIKDTGCGIENHLSVRSKPGKGTTVTMKKVLSRRVGNG